MDELSKLLRAMFLYCISSFLFSCFSFTEHYSCTIVSLVFTKKQKHKTLIDILRSIHSTTLANPQHPIASLLILLNR